MVYPVFVPPPQRKYMSNGTLLAIVLGVLVPAIIAVVILVPRAANSVLTADPRPSIGSIDDYPWANPDLPQILPTLSIGQCLKPIDGANEHPGSGVVPCTAPHNGEVFEIIPVAGSEYPGPAALAAKQPECIARLSAYARMDRVKTMTVYLLTPGPDRWAEGDEAVYCVVGSRTVLTTGSVSRSF